RLPRQGEAGARAHRRLRRRRHLRLHRLQRQRHRHRAAHRGPGRARGLPEPHGLPVGLSPGHPRLPEPGPAPLRDRPRERPPHAQAHGGPAGADPALDPGLQGLRLRQAHLRRERDPGSDARRRRGRRGGPDALEPSQRLHRGGPPPGEPDPGEEVARDAAALKGLRLAGAIAAIALLASPLLAQTSRPAELAVNELGRVMILEYHKIDHPEERWTRTPANFRRDLQRLWERGYRTVALSDYLDGRINLPKGTTPLILTFDDS